MIDAFETSVRINQHAVFFTFVDSAGREASYTYRQARLISAALARCLRANGATPGSTIVADIPNSPELVFLILASSYGEFALALLDNTATEADKISQTLSLERSNLNVVLRLDQMRLMQILGRSREIAYRSMDESALIESISGATRWERSIMGERQDVIDDTVHFAERAAHLFDRNARAFITFTSSEFGKSKIVPLDWKQLMSASELANNVLGEQGKQLWQEKLPLTSRNSINFSSRETVRDHGRDHGQDPNRDVARGASRDLGRNLSRDLSRDPIRESQPLSSGCSWQCVYRLSHIRGFQILVRSVVGRTSFRLYEDFDAELVLKDCERSHVTHISVSDKMLQDLLTVEEWRSDIHPNARIRLAEYQCILVDDRGLNPRTVERSLDLGIRLFAAYGVAETSGVMAQALITPEFRGGMKIMGGYDVHIVDENEDGFGRLAVKGPGVFSGYANTSTPLTVDHYFITGHTAALYDGAIYIRNRSTDMFIVDGENVYPDEIATVLRHVPGVSAVHVFGMVDASGMSYPVAAIEREDPSLSADDVIRMTAPLLVGSSMPKRISVYDSLPRAADGKLDRLAIESMIRDRLEIVDVTVRRIRVPFKNPIQTKDQVRRFRETAIVQVVDSVGRVGLGECMAYDNDWGVAETLTADLEFLETRLIPACVGRTFRHPRELTEVFAEIPGACDHPMAASALECAAWDLFGQVTQKPLWNLLNQEYARIQKLLDGASGPIGSGVMGDAEWHDLSNVHTTSSEDVMIERYDASAHADPLQGTAHTSGNVAVVSSDAVIAYDQAPVVMANAHSAVAAGYKLLKMQITPEKGFASVRSVRRTFPDILITLDANGSFTENDVDQLKAYDSLNIAWIEEPFAAEDGADSLAKMQNVQPLLATPLCADDSYRNANDANRVLAFNDIHCVSVKVAKFGGIQPTLEFIAMAKRLGKVVFMGGMHETGIGRRVSAAFETLPGIVFPGDIGSISRYFKADITYPPYEANEGLITLNGEGFSFGLGCMLNESVVSQLICV